MRTRTRIVTATMIAVALGLFGAEAAHADTNGHGFDEVLPVAQIVGSTGSQTKTYSSKAGSVWNLTVGSKYKVDGQQCKGSSLYCGTKVHNMGGSNYGVLKNTITSGAKTFLEMRVSTFNSVKVEASGYFAGN